MTKLDSSFMTSTGSSIRRFVPHMFGVGFEHLQVAWVVVPPVAVDVVNDFACTERTSEHGRRDDSMNRCFADLGVVDRVLSLESHSTRDRAERPAALVDLGLAQIERGAALFARESSSTLSRLGVTRLGTPRPIAWLTARRALIHAVIIAWFSPHCLRPSRGLFDEAERMEVSA
jgi:hypothetical protein